MKYTPEQEIAINHRGGALLVSAAAGSGKTAVLVERTMRLLCRAEHPVDADKILIVTFTRAAAANLREKLAKRLDEKIALDRGNANLHRQRLLLQRANISTMDSYCQKLLRENFSRLENIPPDFTTAQGAALQRLRRQCLAQTLEVMYADDDFCAFADLYGKGRSDAAAGEAVLQLHDFLTTVPWPEKLLADFEADWIGSTPIEKTKWGSALLSRAKDMAECCLELTQDNMADIDADPALEKYAPSTQADILQLEELLQLIDSGSWDEAKQRVDGFKLTGLKAIRGEVDTACVKQRRELTKNLLKRMAEDIFVCTAQEYAQDMSAGEPLVKALIRAQRDFNRRFWQAKLEEKMLEFSDVEQLALQLLQNADGTPTELALQVREGFEEVMVDEYQDTNALQDALYIGLSKPDACNLMMVGDLKQSIYAFRQAEPGIFSDKLKGYADYAAACAGAPRRHPLDANFRSAPDVIGGINAIFEQIMSPDLGGVAYGPGEKLRPGFAEDPAQYKGVKGACELHLVAGDEEEEAQFAARRIKALLDSGLTVRDGEKNRPLRPEDVCILMRSGNPFETYANALEQQGIHAYVDKRQNILQSPEVLPVASLIRVLDNPAQDIHLATVMMKLYGFDPNDLANIRLAQKHGSFYSAVKAQAVQKQGQAVDDKKAKVSCFVKELERLRSLAQTVPTDRLMEEIFLATGWLAAVGTLPEGERRRENLRSFAQFISQNARGGIACAVRALDAAEEKGIEGSEQGQTKPGCVSIMNVHRSKGLEFPVVLAAGFGKKFNQQDRNNNLALHRKMGLGLTLRQNRAGLYKTLGYAAVQQVQRDEAYSEEMRLLYVAFTRAQDRLIITMCNKKPENVLQEISDTLAQDGKVYEEVLKLSAGAEKWLLTAALLHPAGSGLLSAGAGAFLRCAPDVRHKSEDFTMQVEYPAADEDTVPQPTAAEPEPAPAGYAEKLTKQLAWQYEGRAKEKTPAKVSVTSLVHQRDDIILNRPAFASEKKMTAAERGTATHAFMQFADWEFAQTRGVDAEMNRQVEGGFMAPELQDKLDAQAIEGFMQSDVFRRMKAADKAYREYEYISSLRLNGPEGGDTLIQGVADLILEFSDHVEIVDYKTDRKTTKADLLAAYRDQLLLYARAIGGRFRQPVTKLTIYSFDLNGEVDVPTEKPDEDILQKFQIAP